LPDVRLGLGIVVYEITADCGRQSAWCCRCGRIRADLDRRRDPCERGL